MAIKGKDRKQLRFADFREVDAAAEDLKFKDFEYTWRNNGIRPDGKKLEMQDALAMWESPLFIPKVVNNIVQEAVEPMLIGVNLLEKIKYTPGTVVTLPVFGAVDGDFDVGESESYPELRLAYGPGAQISSCGKSGVAIKFTDEVLRYSQYDVISMGVSAAAKAMARNKEEKVFNLLYNVAKVSHDNDTPARSQFGTTTGRDLTGAQNGSFTMDDLFEMFTMVAHNGYNADLILVHPLTWLMFVQDAQLRHFAQMNQSAFFGSQWSGSPAKNDFFAHNGGMGVSGGIRRSHPADPIGDDGDGSAVANTPFDFSQNLSSAPVIPSYFGLSLRLITSPFVPFDAVNNKTTVLVADSSQLGYYIEDHPIMTSEWKDPETDLTKLKLWERFTLREKNRGNGIAVAKNVVVTANQVLLPAQSTIAVDGSISNLTRNVAI